jgi:hypothetical protein
MSRKTSWKTAVEVVGVEGSGERGEPSPPQAKGRVASFEFQLGSSRYGRRRQQRFMVCAIQSVNEPVALSR